ncbi:MAG: hypothetical protein A2X94_13600 [Bdellovibrionales bacterium GWB1_55_8]|nr:MAG: hypothetical protein A2X94_13600 [Bdellovibrionales bacterium GWB1_55_8]
MMTPVLLAYPGQEVWAQKNEKAFCMQERTVLAVAKAALSDGGKIDPTSETTKFSARREGDNWIVVWSDTDYLDGRIRLDISRKSCAIVKFHPQYSGK